MTPELTHLTDFSDRLSPMLVKELRQGMRARSFTVLFLVFQCLLALILLSAGASESFGGAGAFASSTIFTMFGIAVLGIQPLRGINALSSEISSNTIEMMALTRLSAWRIVFGKWIAIVSQSALIMVTIIPYLILRYFFGGMLLLGELVFLGMIFLTSMALTAITVGFSASPAKLVRALPVLAIIFLLFAGPSSLGISGAIRGMSFFTLSDMESRVAIVSYLCFFGYFGWTSLSQGTSAIAPISENHSTPRRLVALALALVALGCCFLNFTVYEPMGLVFGVILAPILVFSLTEPADVVVPICKPFVRRGVAGRIAALFLLPGWPSGALFSVGMIAIAAAGMGYKIIDRGHGSFAWYFAPFLSVLGGLLLPALLSIIFSKQESKRFPNFILFMLASVVLTIVPTILASANDQEELLWFFVWNPPIGLALMANHVMSEPVGILKAMAIIDGLIVLGLLISGILGQKRYRDAMESAREDSPAVPEQATP